MLPLRRTHILSEAHKAILAGDLNRAESWIALAAVMSECDVIIPTEESIDDSRAATSGSANDLRP